MAVIAGNANGTVIISDAFTGVAGSEEPSGNKYPFLCDQITYDGKPLDKFSEASTFVARYPTNKKALSAAFKDCYISSEQTPTSTQELDLIEDFFMQSSIKTGASKVYLFLYINGRYKKLSWNTAYVHLQYMKGQINGWKSKLTGDELIWKLDFGFKEATLP